MLSMKPTMLSKNVHKEIRLGSESGTGFGPLTLQHFVHPGIHQVTSDRILPR